MNVKISVMATFIFAILLYSDLCFAATGKVKMRARENYEKIQVATDLGETKFEGFSHTLNLWYEIPFNYAIGLGFGPFAVGYNKVEESLDDQTLGDKIKLFNTGLEVKYWHDLGVFVRGGAYHEAFNGNAPDGKDVGYGALLGFGYEYNFGGWGLALEGDYRRSTLSHKKWHIDSQIIAIGVHFYDML